MDKILNRRIAIGTAQFGMNYGVANQDGQVGAEELRRILEYALYKGARILDTAIAYGNAEQCLGTVGVADWRVITKLPRLPSNLAVVERWVGDTIVESLHRLGLDYLYGLLLHNPQDLLGPDGDALYGSLIKLKSLGLVGKVGISVYSPEEAFLICSRYKFDLIQFPMNIIDQRFIRSDLLPSLKSQGIETYARSIFLQGLLLMPKEKRPIQFTKWQELWDRWDTKLVTSNTSPMKACMNFALSQTLVDNVVVGIDSSLHLHEIYEATKDSYTEEYGEFNSSDLNLINPAKWMKK